VPVALAIVGHVCFTCHSQPVVLRQTIVTHAVCVVGLTLGLFRNPFYKVIRYTIQPDQRQITPVGALHGSYKKSLPCGAPQELFCMRHYFVIGSESNGLFSKKNYGRDWPRPSNFLRAFYCRGTQTRGLVSYWMMHYWNHSAFIKYLRQILTILLDLLI
jgi:hypothetical protein